MRGFVSAGVALGIGIGLLSGLSEHASAQVIPDNTLGAEDSELVPRQEGGLQIEGGAVRGESLFHSFAEFSIDAGEIIYFANPAAIETILGRVTGEVRSDILGTLGVDGTASLYLINPNGIVFGPDAQLDIAGSLFVSAAPSLDLGEGISFSAVEPTTIPLLTVSVMPGLPLGQDLSGEISSNEATLRVGDELTLAAGKIELEGGLLEADGDLFVGANQLFLRDGASILSEAGTEDGGNITIEVGSLTLEDGASIASNTLGTGRGGDLTINASESITLQSSDPENFPSFIGSSALEGAGDTGSVNVTADTLFLDDGSYILNDTFSESTGNAGDLSIDIRRLVMDGDSIISSSTYGEGNGGVLTIRATESIAMNSSIIEAIAYKGTGDADDVSLTADELFLDEGSFIWSETLSESTGNAGDLTVDVRRLVIEGEPRSIISSSTCGEGDGGALVIRSTESVLLNTGSIWAAVFEGTGNAGDLSITADELLLDGFSFILSDTFSEGDAGDLTIDVRHLALENDSVLSSATEGSGDAGNFSITADELSLVGASFIASGVFVEGSGNAGDLTIDVGNLLLEDGSSIGSSTFAGGDAGALTIRATESITVDFSFIEAAAFKGAAGDAGDLNITADSLSLVNRSFLGSDVLAETTGDAGDLIIDVRQLFVEDALISSATAGEGDAGNLTIRASESIELRGQGTAGTLGEILSEVRVGATGNAGDVTITTGQLLLEDDTRISTSSLGTGQAGSLRITATEAVVVADDSSLEAITTGGGPVGSLSLTTPQLTVRDSGALLVSSEGNFPAGTLTVDAEQIRLRDNASLRAETEAGDEGNIALDTEGILLRDDSSITTNATESATGGRIDIDAASFLLLLDRSFIEARATEGQGGDINIATELFLQSEDSAIDASSELGVDGTVNFDVVETDVPTETEALSTTFASAELSQQCAFSQEESEGGQFIRTGRTGLPVDADAINSAGLWEDQRLRESVAEESLIPVPLLLEQPTEPASGAESVVEAQGWRRESGWVVLAAEPIAVTPYSALQAMANCRAG